MEIDVKCCQRLFVRKANGEFFPRDDSADKIVGSWCQYQREGLANAKLLIEANETPPILCNDRGEYYPTNNRARTLKLWCEQNNEKYRQQALASGEEMKERPLPLEYSRDEYRQHKLMKYCYQYFLADHMDKSDKNNIALNRWRVKKNKELRKAYEILRMSKCGPPLRIYFFGFARINPLFQGDKMLRDLVREINKKFRK